MIGLWALKKRRVNKPHGVKKKKKIKHIIRSNLDSFYNNFQPGSTCHTPGNMMHAGKMPEKFKRLAF